LPFSVLLDNWIMDAGHGSINYYIASDSGRIPEEASIFHTIFFLPFSLILYYIIIRKNRVKYPSSIFISANIFLAISLFVSGPIIISSWSSAYAEIHGILASYALFWYMDFDWGPTGRTWFVLKLSLFTLGILILAKKHTTS